MNKYGFRITKYNPKNRNELGHYMIDEWTSISDLVRYDVNLVEYESIEQAYVNFIVNLLNYFQYEELHIFSLQKNLMWDEVDNIRLKGLGKNGEILFTDILNNKKSKLSLDDISLFIKFTLREMLWAILIGKNIEVHFGYDYYMYILTSDPKIVDYIKASNYDLLYIEEVALNYFEKDDDWIKSNGYNEEHFK